MDLGVPGFEGQEEIGRGGFGVVYRARDLEHERDVAIKIITAAVDESTRRRFDRERRAMGALSGHPNITTVYTSGYCDNGSPFLVMELLTNGSLRARLEREGALGWEEVAGIGVKLADALRLAHSKGVLHRDIKPENVLLSSWGEPKLTDFGIAVITTDLAATRTTVSATPLYAPPEVLDGRDADERSDVYSLAATLFALIEGTPAYARQHDTSILSTLTRIATEPVPRLSVEVPAGLRELLYLAMAKDPSHRPATAAEFGSALRAAGTGAVTPAPQPDAANVTAHVSVLPPLPGPAAASSSPARPAGPPPLPAPPPVPSPSPPLPSAPAAPVPSPLLPSAPAAQPRGGPGPLPFDGAVGGSPGAKAPADRRVLVGAGLAAVVVVAAVAAIAVLGRGGGDGTQATGGVSAAGPTVPDVVGERLEVARTALVDAGYGVRWPAHCDDVVQGQDPAGGSPAEPGSDVVLALAPCVVPEVVGLRRDEAAQRVQAAGLRATWPAHCDDRVLGTDPAPGTEVEPGSEVVLQLEPC